MRLFRLAASRPPSKPMIIVFRGFPGEPVPARDFFLGAVGFLSAEVCCRRAKNCEFALCSDTVYGIKNELVET